MNKELKYPVKYAILELKEAGGYLLGYKDITQGFIVSKCYVVESWVKYFSNGDSEITHKVVFPFKNISVFKLSLQHGFLYNSDAIPPSFNASGNYYPVDIVSNLFDSYEEAHKIATPKNEEMQHKLILEIPYSEPDMENEYERLKMEFLENLNICQKFEELILMKTENMEISDTYSEFSGKKLQKDNIY